MGPSMAACVAWSALAMLTATPQLVCLIALHWETHACELGGVVLLLFPCCPSPPTLLLLPLCLLLLQ